MVELMDRTIMNDRVMGIMQITRSLGDIEYKSMKEYYWKMEFDVINTAFCCCLGIG